MLVVLTTSPIMMGPHHAATVESLLTTRVGQTISWSTYHESRDKFFSSWIQLQVGKLARAHWKDQILAQVCQNILRTLGISV